MAARILSCSSRHTWKEGEDAEDHGDSADNIKQWTDPHYNIRVRTGCRRSQSLEGNRKSSDGGRRSNMVCRKEEMDTQHIHLGLT